MKNPFEGFGKKIVLGTGLLLSASGAMAQGPQDTTSTKNPNDLAREQVEATQSNAKQATPEQIQKARNFYEDEREWLLKTVSSPEYKKRLIEKEGLTEADVAIRIKNVLNTSIEIGKGQLSYVSDDTINKSPITGTTVTNNDGTSTMILPSLGYKAPLNFGLVIHEGAHGSTQADTYISDTAKQLYHEAFNYNGPDLDTLLKMPGIVSSQNGIDFAPDAPIETQEAFDAYVYWYNYESRPTELDARKKVLEYEMDILGIKKYGEEFTQDHLDKVYSMFNDLSPNSREFLRFIKPEYMIKVMNTIADNGAGNISVMPWSEALALSKTIQYHQDQKMDVDLSQNQG